MHCLTRTLLPLTLLLMACSSHELQRKPASALGACGATECIEANAIWSASQGLLLSDSFVQNLSCKNLAEANVFNYIRPEAISREKQIPLGSCGGGNLGQCWGLMVAQRHLFYLGRWQRDDLNEQTLQSNADSFLQSLRGERAAEILGFRSSDLFARGANRAFVNKAFDSDFMELILGEKGERFRALDISVFAQTNNQRSFQEITNAFSRGERPIVAIRANDGSFLHAVLLLETVQSTATRARWRVLDPTLINQLSFLEFENGHFYAPQSLAAADKARPDGELQAAVVEQESMQQLRRTTYAYYSSLCGRLKLAQH